MNHMRRDLYSALCGLILGIAVTHVDFVKEASLSAQSGPKTSQRCDYTYVRDGSQPNIGAEGEIKYNNSWKAVVEGGWTLKAIGGNAGSIYLFEKCR